MINRTTTSFDGVVIAYSVSGTAETALVFIHGGMSNRSDWNGQHEVFSGRFRVLALDLAGHGESGQNRREWGMAQFARDVVAVMDAEKVSRAVLIGNSLGGPVAIETALLAPGRVLAIIGVDTLHDLGRTTDAEMMNHAADEWQKDPAASLDRGLKILLHDDMDPHLYEEIRRRMARTPPEVVCAMYRSFGGYNAGAAAAKINLPIRAICGDRFPMDVEAVRRVVPDFDAVVLRHIGHYPMLECPAEFDRRLSRYLDDLGVIPSAPASKVDSSGG